MHSWFALPMHAAVRFLRKPLLGLVVVVGLLLLAEGVLTLIGFERSYARVYISSDPDHPDNATKAIIDDPELLWRFQPGLTFQGRPINELGFLGRALPRKKVPGVVRVLCMGDSCTAEGEPPYADLLHGLLNGAGAQSTWEAFNMAVHGYSVVQGRKLFNRDGAAFKPDYVTLYFGWNAHWLDQYPDRTRMQHEQHRFAAKVYRKLMNRRLFQFLVYLSDPSGKRLRSDKERVLRVPPDQYVDELRAFISDIRKAGAEPVVLTAPRAERLSHHLVRNGNVASVDQAAALHDQYVGLTRNVAEEMGVSLVDLAAQLEQERPSGLFRQDGVHLTQRGLERTAEIIHATLADGVDPY